MVGRAASCRCNIKQNNVMATVGTAGGHQLLLGIADDLQPHGHNCSVWSLHVSDTTASPPPPPSIPGAGQQNNVCGPNIIYINEAKFGKKVDVFKKYVKP